MGGSPLTALKPQPKSEVSQNGFNLTAPARSCRQHCLTVSVLLRTVFEGTFPVRQTSLPA